MYVIVMQILIPVKLSKIYKPVWEEKKKLKEETRKYKKTIENLKNQTNANNLLSQQGERENEKS